MTTALAPDQTDQSADAVLSAEEHLARIKGQERFVVQCREDYQAKNLAAKAAKKVLETAEAELHVQIATPEAELPYGEPQG